MTGPGSKLRDEADKHQIDVNKLPAEVTAEKIDAADMDATIIRGEFLDELAELAGIAEQINRSPPELWQENWISMRHLRPD